MAKDLKITTELRYARPFIAGVSGDVAQSGNAHYGGDITCSGNITANSYINIFHNHGRQISDSNWDYRGLSIYTQDGSAPSLTFYQEGDYAGRLGLQGAKLVWGGLSLGAVAYEIFHQGNPQVVMLTNEATVYGGANLGVGNYSINVTSYGIPRGCKAVIVRINGKWNTANEGYFFAMKSSTNSRYPLVRAQVANMSIDGYGMAAVKGNILRYEVAGASSFVYLKILGYVK